MRHTRSVGALSNSSKTGKTEDASNDHAIIDVRVCIDRFGLFSDHLQDTNCKDSHQGKLLHPWQLELDEQRHRKYQ